MFMRQMDDLHWDLALSFVALIVNVFLCSSQIIIFINLGEYSQVRESKIKTKNTVMTSHITKTQKHLLSCPFFVELKNTAAISNQAHCIPGSHEFLRCGALYSPHGPPRADIPGMWCGVVSSDDQHHPRQSITTTIIIMIMIMHT